MLRTLLLKLLVGALFGFCTGLADDLRLLKTYRKREQWAEFDLVVAVERWIAGAVYGAITGLGVGTAGAIGVIPE